MQPIPRPLTPCGRPRESVFTEGRNNLVTGKLAIGLALRRPPVGVSVSVANRLARVGRTLAALAILVFALCATLSRAAASDVLVPAGATWKYLDDGSDQGTAWRGSAFDDASWPSGPAQLGYGDGDESTTVGYGPDPGARYITTYFRHTFTVGDASVYESLDLRVLRDDGAIVYLNGSEIFRTNMNPGTVTFTTLAASAIVGIGESAWHPAYLDASALVDGDNVLAVEIHQSAAASSDISLDLGLEASTTAAPIEFAWAGALTPTSVRVNAKSKIEGGVRLHVSHHPDLSGARVSGVFPAADATNDRVVSIAMRGLDPSTSYHYALEVDGAIDVTKKGRFTTPLSSPLTFTFALASCALTGSSHPVFDTVRGWNPRFFFHLGDMHYENIGVDDPALFRGAYETVLDSPTQSALYRDVPIAYVWDDHDYGPNNADATAPGRTSARLTYQQYVPHYPLIAGIGDVPISQAFSIGRVRFIVTDSRSERSPFIDPDTPAKTMLGAAQKAWFKQELLDASGVYPVIVWVNTLPWIGSTGDDGWYAYTYERREIADFIKDNGVSGLFMISGDAHMLAIDDGTNSDYATGGGAGFPVMHAAALDQGGSVKGGPYSEGAFPGGGQFGLMTVQDDGVSPVCVVWSGRDSSNAEIVGWSRCDAMPPPADTDGDTVVDVADCAFADPTAWARPTSVSGLGIARSGATDMTLSWSSQDAAAGPSTRYDIVSGALSVMRADGDLRGAGCLIAGQPDTPYLDSSGLPAPGDGAYFLVRAANVCGSGRYGQGTAADPSFPLEGDAPCPLP